MGGPVVGSMAVAALTLVLGASSVGAAPSAPASSSTGWVVDKVRFEPVDPATPLTLGNNEYRGAIEVTGTGGGVSTINDVDLDDYVRGIAEVPPSWPAMPEIVCCTGSSPMRAIRMSTRSPRNGTPSAASSSR